MFPSRAACDCHVHVVGPKSRFPLAAVRAYTPKAAPVDALATMLQRLGLERVVLVQPSFYGTDNACMLDALARLPQARGVAVLAAQTTEAELQALHERGIRGLRINVATSGRAALESIRTRMTDAVRLCEAHGWHLQIFARAEEIEALAPLLRALPVDTVIDHFGLVAPDANDGALATLRDLLATGKTWVKISGAYRIAEDPNDPRIGPLARKLCTANPERIVWGSDWPHTPHAALRKANSDEELPFQAIDTHGLLHLLPRWLEDDSLLQQVLVHNPARLYGFD